jgi:lipopolysaccharide export system protein LptA
MAINYFVNFTTYDGWAVSGNFSVDYSSNPPILVAHNINAVGLSNINYNQGQSFLAAINSLGAGVYYLRIDNYDYSVLDVLYRDDGSNGGSIILDNSNTGYHSPFGTDGGASDGTISEAVASITSAAYDASTGTLTVTGSNLTTSAGDDINASRLTITGQSGSSYTLTNALFADTSSSTSFTVMLSNTDKLNVNGLLNKNGTSSVNSTTFNLAGSAGWHVANPSAADLTGNSITVSNVVAPTIASGQYDASTGVLTVTGSNLVRQVGASNDISVNKLTLFGEGPASLTLTSSDVEIISGTSFAVTLNASDRAYINQFLNKNGTSSSSGTTYNLYASDDWNTSITGSNIADTSNPLTVINVPTPTITSATYDATTGTLTVTGANLTTSASADIISSRLIVTGQDSSTYALTDTADAEIISSTSFTVMLSSTDKLNVNGLLNRAGTSSVGGTTFNLAGSAGWHSANPSAADLTSNGITVSNVVAPSITSGQYDASTGVLTVTGSNLVKQVGSSNDISVNKLTLRGEGLENFTLTSSNVEITSGTAFAVTLNALDRAYINTLLNKNGTSSTSGSTYTLSADDDWNTSITGSNIADASNALTVSNVSIPTITSASYNASTGVLVVTGAGFLQRSGANNDIDVSKFSIRGQGGSRHSLTSANVEITSGTSFTVTLNSTDVAAVAPLLNRNGTSSSDSTTYSLEASEDWARGADSSVVVADSSGNGITVTSVDTTPPSAPSRPYLSTASDSGTSSSDNITSDSTPTLTGTAESYSLVTVYDTDGSTVLGTATADGAGNWSVTTSVMSEGSHTLTSKAADAMGNISTTSAGLEIVIDSTAPSAPSTPDLSAISDSGTSNTDNITSVSTPTLTGTAEAGSVVTVYDTDGSTVLGTATATDGIWSVTTSNLSDGVHILTSKEMDTAGNTSSASAGLVIVIDSAAQGVDSINRVTGQLTSGASVDFTVSFAEAVTGVDINDFLLSSTGSADGTIAAVSQLSASTYTVSVNTINGDGSLRLDLKSVGTGITDIAGNAITTGFSSGQTYTIDTTVPTVTSFSPSDGATNVAVGSNVVSSFSEAIQRGTGTIFLRSGSSTGTIIEQFNAATSDRLSLDGSTLTIDPTANLAGDTQYFVTFDAGTVQDLAGNNFAGTSSYDFRTVFQVSYSLPSSSIQSIGFTPDGQSLLIKTGGRVSSVVLGTSLEFTDQVLSTSDLINTMTPLTAFQSSGAVSGYTLPEIFTGDASLNLQYQLIEAADNAVVIGSQYNDFIKLASTNSQGKAVNGGGGNDVIDGGVGSTFITGSGTSANSTTYFLDGRAPGISWSTITDFKLDVDKVTIWGFVKGVSSVDTSFANFNTDGAGGYEGLTLHFKNLLPSGQTSGSNPNLNSITLSGRTLEEFGASSLTELNNQINNQTNPNFLVGSTQDSFGTHEYLFIN